MQTRAVQSVCSWRCTMSANSRAASRPRHRCTFPECFNVSPESVVSAHFDHAAAGLALFNADRTTFLGDGDVDMIAWRALVRAVVGHHGSPPDVPTKRGGVRILRPDFHHAGLAAAESFGREVRQILGGVNLPEPDEERANRSSFLLAGLAVLADWLGSNERWFSYHEPEADLLSYWNNVARERAEDAVRASGVLTAPPSKTLSYKSLIGNNEPSPMQEWANDVDLPDGPSLFLIEDETGSGKTEAAVMLAHRLMRAGRGDGVYVALPTMATANAMFDRLASAHRLLFVDDAGTVCSIGPRSARPARQVPNGATLRRRARSAVFRVGRHIRRCKRDGVGGLRRLDRGRPSQVFPCRRWRGHRRSGVAVSAAE